MATSPYMPLYIADYMADTAHLTTEEHGAYLLLIMTYWQRGKALPRSFDRLANVARMSNDRWQSVATTLAEFFDDDGTHWIHPRIEAELARFRAKSEQAKAAGLASAQRQSNARTNARSTDVPTPVQHPLQRNDNHTDTDKDKELKEKPNPNGLGKKKAPERRATRLPEDWIIPDDWLAWASRERPQIDPKLEAQKFRDHWIAKAGKDGRKLDWLATWRNWVRNARAGGGPRDEAHQRRDNSAPGRVRAAQQRRDAAQGRTFEHGAH